MKGLYKWDSYAATMPVSRKTMILCQCIETGITELCTYLILIISNAAASLLIRAGAIAVAIKLYKKRDL